MNLINIQNRLPEFGKKVIFRAVITWKNKPEQDVYFDDVLTNQEETLEYGQWAYLLKTNSDFLVSRNPAIGEVCDEYVTHWCEISENFDSLSFEEKAKKEYQKALKIVEDYEKNNPSLPYEFDEDEIVFNESLKKSSVGWIIGSMPTKDEKEDGVCVIEGGVAKKWSKLTRAKQGYYNALGRFSTDVDLLTYCLKEMRDDD